MYYADSMEQRIRRYDWNSDAVDISNLKYIFDYEKIGVNAFQDGGTIDTDGNLWWCAFNDSCVLEINPNTREVSRKVKQVTSGTFGGPNLDILFVTTASLTMPDEQKPPCGAVFRVTGLGVQGHPNLTFKL